MRWPSVAGVKAAAGAFASKCVARAKKCAGMRFFARRFERGAAAASFCYCDAARIASVL
jgi:hypothetical protein